MQLNARRQLDAELVANVYGEFTHSGIGATDTNELHIAKHRLQIMCGRIER